MRVLRPSGSLLYSTVYMCTDIQTVPVSVLVQYCTAQYDTSS